MDAALVEMSLPSAALVPLDAPLAMPVQDLRGPVPAGPGAAARPLHYGRVIAARLIAFGGAAAAALIGCQQMLAALGDAPTLMQFALLALFTPSFAWVGFSFFSMISGLFVRRIQTPAATDPVRLAIVMPIYHEDAAASLGALVALARDLAKHNLSGSTEIFVLSDSRRPDAALAERLAVIEARALSPLPIWYRRRAANTEHKSGNVADFIRRWGGRYDQMLVLDADSVMSGDTVAALSARMQADPALGLIQTMPMLIGGETIFARLTQFAGRIYGPMIARGVAAWSGDNGNYWGHNAIIRVSAFASCCGLPRLSGQPPFGGPVLSHDFVEAALLRRAGWKVRLDHDLRGSFEGSPPSLIDVAKRERRWAQGNLQHLRLLRIRGLTAITRAHFIIGVLGFVMSPVWLALILVGLALSASVLLSTPEYFPDTYQLFPSWPVFDARRMLWLFAATMGFLLLPKLAATLRAWWRPLARQSGGRRRVLQSALFETLLSALIAPVQMLTQTRQIAEILRGRDSGWGTQLRAGVMPPWGVVWRRHGLHFGSGVATLAVLAFLSPAELIWLSPILAGLILSPVTSRYSASPVWGRWARMRGLLVTPEERDPPAIAAEAAALARRLPRRQDGASAFASLGRDPDRLAALRDLAQGDATTESARMHAVAARAKIAHASSRDVALAHLTDDELVAMLDDARALDDWGRAAE